MSPDSANSWQPLSVIERRVLGVLVEKQKTTDTYPLTLNAIVTGCNQKSNRDPIFELDDEQVELALAELQKKGLVTRLISGRADKWKHNLYDVWKVSSPEIAILAELLLRGPQTEGELRARASRMDDIADLDALRQLLVPLRDRKLVVYLTPENRRGSVLTHGFHDPNELQRLAINQSMAPAEDESMASTSATSSLTFDTRLKEIHVEITELRQNVETMRAEITALSQSIQRLYQELGVPPK
jgi:uncharacterized protein YceH (UPF0502 family)